MTDAQAARAFELALDWLGHGPDAVDLEANRRWWFSLYGYVLEECGQTERAAAVAEELWRHHRAGDWLLPAEDAVHTLEVLAAAGHRMAVISNWDDTLDAVLERRGLRGFFEFALASSAVGHGKPRREIFARALELAGVRAAEAVHIGDDPVADVAGAAAVGIRPVFLGARALLGERRSHAAIRSLSQLPALLGHRR